MDAAADETPSASQYLVLYAGATCVLAVAHVALAYAAVTLFGRCRAVNPQHKMMYVTAELVKASVLMASMCCPSWYWMVYRTLVYNEWDNPEVVHVIKLFVLWYCASDLSQFVTVKIAQASTKQHHAATSLFGLLICFTAEYAPLTRALLWYGLCSTVAFLTNAYKALRVLYGPTLHMERTRWAAYFMYKFELAVNWPVHAAYICLAALDAVQSRSFGKAAAVVGYLFATKIFVKDDLELLRFLSKPGVVPPAETKYCVYYDTKPTYIMPHGVAVLLDAASKIV